MEMRLAGVTDFSTISLNDYQTVKNFGHIRSLVKFMNLCLEEVDELKKNAAVVCWMQNDRIMFCINVSQR